MQISELAREMGANKYDKKCDYSNLKPISNLLSIIPQTKKIRLHINVVDK